MAWLVWCLNGFQRAFSTTVYLDLSCHHPYFANVEAQVQRCQVTCPRLHSLVGGRIYTPLPGVE